MTTLLDLPRFDRPAGARMLPADLAKLRDRFLAEYPEEAERVERLAQVPAALRHILSMRLELDREDGLPRHYRDLATAVLRGTTARRNSVDAVDQVVIGYAVAVRGARHRDAAALLPDLRRFFTESQIVELVLTLTLARALAGFDALLGVRSGRDP